MKELIERIIKELKNRNEEISFMESCTGGLLVNLLTNIEGSSEILKVSLVTYSNEYKVKFGVNENIIDKYGVYSIETANEMAKATTNFSKATFGIGITRTAWSKRFNE